jgi:vacuolar-type H+-ATPase subunit H
MEIKLHIQRPSELSAGIRGFTEDVTVTLKDTPQSENEIKKELTESLREFFAEWFDGARVYTEEEWEAIIASENKSY